MSNTPGIPSDWNQIDSIAYLLMFTISLSGSGPGQGRADAMLAVLREYEIEGRRLSVDQVVNHQVRAANLLKKVNKSGGSDMIIATAQGILGILKKHFGADTRKAVALDILRVITAEGRPHEAEVAFLEYVCKEWGVQLR